MSHSKTMYNSVLANSVTMTTMQELQTHRHGEAADARERARHDVPHVLSHLPSVLPLGNSSSNSNDDGHAGARHKRYHRRHVHHHHHDGAQQFASSAHGATASWSLSSTSRDVVHAAAAAASTTTTATTSTLAGAHLPHAPPPELFDSEVEKSRSRSDNYGVNNYTRHLLHLHHQHVNMDDSHSPSCSSRPADEAPQPLSYFDANNTCGEFSWQNEMDCLANYLHHLLHTIEEDRLPWLTDFADVDKMRAPRTRAEVLTRLNLNIPYYASNYLQLCYAVTLPFLFVYNRAFLLVVAAACLLAHTIAIRRKYMRTYSRAAVLLGRRIPYHALGHALLASLLVLFVFFDGLRTTALVVLLNVLLVVPHALWRIPTYFDDEDLEKLRPKLVQYALLLCFLVLAYLEGDVEAPEEEGKKAAKREMDRLGLTHLYAKRRRLSRRAA